MTPKPIGVGALFQEDAHGVWMRLTGSRYNAMMDRLVKKKLIDKEHPPFTCDQYRQSLLTAMNGKEDGFVQCRYCRGFFGVKDIGSDHAVPLHRQGSVGLDNLEFPCKRCNSIKGKLTPDELLLLMAFLEKEIPLARMEVLNRLEISVQLVIGHRANAPVINELKESGAWAKVQQARKQRKRDKEAGLGVF
jgi:5-methylcytosine-specific restriction endonuclease McrA